MRLRHIEVFHAVYLTGSVSGGARALNVSQPTISKVLRHAEMQLGFDLFHRERGRLFPTDKGKLLFEQTQPVFEQINELRKYAGMLASTHIGQLRLVMTPAFSLDVVPKVITEFSRRHSDVAIEVETLHAAEISKSVSNNTADIGLALEAVEAPGLTVTSIGQCKFVCVAPVSFALKRGAVRLEDLAGFPLIRLNAKSPLGQLLNNRLAEALDVEPQGQIVAETYHLAKRLAAQGAGIAIIDNITALSGNLDGVTLHAVTDIDPVRLDVVSRMDEPFIGYKSEFMDLLVAETARFQIK